MCVLCSGGAGLTTDLSCATLGKGIHMNAHGTHMLHNTARLFKRIQNGGGGGGADKCGGGEFESELADVKARMR